MDLQQGNVGRVDTGDTGSLAESPRLDLLQLGARLGLQAGHGVEVEPVWDGAVLVDPVAVDVRLLAFKITGRT